MKKYLNYTVLTVFLSFGMAGCLSSTKELTVSERGKTYYASEKECPFYELNEDDTVKCSDKNGNFLKTLRPLNPQEIHDIRYKMIMNKLDKIESRQRWNNQMARMEFYHYYY